MGQAKARGTKEQRVAEATERAMAAQVALRTQQEAERKALNEIAQAAQVARNKENAERLERGEQPLPKRSAMRNRLATSTLIAAASIALMYR